MSDDTKNSRDTGASRRRVLNLDEVKPEPTGDPLIDRGMELTLDGLKEALADPDNPDHGAAKAANAYLGEQMRDALDSAYGDTFRRIGENLAAAINPNRSDLFTASRVGTPHLSAQARSERWRVQMADLTEMELEPNETPAKTLEALLEVAERMSEMVRVSAEHRDVALQQMEHFKAEAGASRKSERRMFVLTWLALIGTWGAVVVALFTL